MMQADAIIDGRMTDIGMLHFLQLVLTPPDSSLLYIGHYDPLLVGLSIGVAILAAYAAFLVAQLVTTNKTPLLRRAWTLIGGLCMGAGIWTMHFVGMLAFSLPCATGYDLSITLISMVPGMLASTLALRVISRPPITSTQLLASSPLLGTGIGFSAGFSAARNSDRHIKYTAFSNADHAYSQSTMVFDRSIVTYNSIKA